MNSKINGYRKTFFLDFLKCFLGDKSDFTNKLKRDIYQTAQLSEPSNVFTIYGCIYLKLLAYLFRKFICCHSKDRMEVAYNQNKKFIFCFILDWYFTTLFGFYPYR